MIGVVCPYESQACGEMINRFIHIKIEEKNYDLAINYHAHAETIYIILIHWFWYEAIKHLLPHERSWYS